MRLRTAPALKSCCLDPGNHLFGNQWHACGEGRLPVYRESLHEASDKAGPRGLMASAEAFTGVPMKIFVEVEEVAPMCMVLKFFRVAKDGAFSGGIT